MANEDFSDFYDDETFRKFKEMIDRIFGGQFGQNFGSFMNFFNDPNIIKKLQDEGRVDIGFSLSTDENGNVNINSFNPGMTFPNQIDNPESSLSEPYFDIIEDGDEIVIVGDVAGYSKENIHIGSKASTKLIIKGISENKSFTKELDLPAFDTKSVKAKLRNGTLEIKVSSIQEKEDSSHKIKIE